MSTDMHDGRIDESNQVDGLEPPGERSLKPVEIVSERCAPADIRVGGDRDVRNERNVHAEMFLERAGVEAIVQHGDSVSAFVQAQEDVSAGAADGIAMRFHAVDGEAD